MSGIGWLRRKPRTLVELLTEQLGRPDPVRVPSLDIPRALYPLAHRHCN